MEKLKVFIASSFLNKKRVRQVAKMLERRGISVTSTWTSHRPTVDRAVLAQEAIKDLANVARADILLVLWPGRTGTLTEMGAALGMGKEVVVCLDAPFVIERPNPLHMLYFNHPSVITTETVAQALSLFEAGGYLWGRYR